MDRKAYVKQITYTSTTLLVYEYEYMYSTYTTSTVQFMIFLKLLKLFYKS